MQNEIAWLEYFWPNEAPGQQGTITIRANWSYPLTQLNAPYQEIAALKELLLDSVGDSARVSAAESGLPEPQVYAESFGTQAEAVDTVMAVLQDLPTAFVQDVLVEGIKFAGGAFLKSIYNHLKERRAEAGGETLTINASFSPSALVELCGLHFSTHMSEQAITNVSWTLVPRDSIPGPWVWRPTIDVVIQGELWVGSYRVDDSGHVYSFRVGDRVHERPDLLRPYPDPEPWSRYDQARTESIWPSQDQIDRSRHINMIVRLDVPYENFPFDDEALQNRIFDLSTELQRLSERTMSDAISASPGTDRELYVDSQPYQIGPAAGGLLDFGHHAVTLYENREAVLAILDGGLNIYALARILIDTRNSLTKWASKQQVPGLGVEFAYSPADLEILCTHFIQVHYHSKAKLVAESYCLTQDFYDGIQSPAHPTESLEYLVLVRSKKRTYKFRVWGNGKVSELTVSRKGREQRLPVPDLFEDESAPIS